MRGLLCACILIFSLLYAHGQMTSGLTGKPDTSFSNRAALRSAKKKHPDIKLVTEQSLSNVAEKRGITYCTYTNRDLKLDAVPLRLDFRGRSNPFDRQAGRARR